MADQKFDSYVDPATFFSAGAMAETKREKEKWDEGGFENTERLDKVGTFEGEVRRGSIFRCSPKNPKLEGKTVAILEVRCTKSVAGEYVEGTLYNTFNVLGMPGYRTSADKINYREVVTHLGACLGTDLYQLEDDDGQPEGSALAEMVASCFQEDGALLVGAKVRVKVDQNSKGFFNPTLSNVAPPPALAE